MDEDVGGKKFGRTPNGNLFCIEVYKWQKWSMRTFLPSPEVKIRIGPFPF